MQISHAIAGTGQISAILENAEFYEAIRLRVHKLTALVNCGASEAIFCCQTSSFGIEDSDTLGS